MNTVARSLLWFHHRYHGTHNREEKTRSQLAAIVESSEDANHQQDPGRGDTSCESGMQRRCFGYAAHECIGQPMLMCSAESRWQERKFLARLQPGAYRLLRTVWGFARDGRGWTFRSHFPIRGSQGDVVRRIHHSRAILHRKQVDRQAQCSVDRLTACSAITVRWRRGRICGASFKWSSAASRQSADRFRLHRL